MLRSRVRRSFTVEVKSKNRHTLSWPDDPTPAPVNWAALDPAPETPSPFDPFWSDEPAPAAPPVPAEKPRRILQSLIVAEPEPAPASEPEVAREPRLPRVRRVKPPQTQSDVLRSDVARAETARPLAGRLQAARPQERSPQDIRSQETRSEAIWSFADIADASSDPAVASPSIAVPPASVAPATVTPRKPPRARTSEPALAPGERWKRRLPRSCR